MNKGDLTYLFFDFLFSTIVVCVCIYFAFVKKRIIKWEDASNSKKQWMKEHESRINKIIVCGMIGAIILFTEGSIIPYMRDIPYIMRKEYMIAEGWAENQDHGGRDEEEKRSVWIVSGNGDKIQVSFFDDYVNEGEKLTVVYLPHSKFGTRMSGDSSVSAVALSVPKDKTVINGWECLLCAAGMLGAFILVYRYDKKHARSTKSTADNYTITVPVMLKHVYMLVFVAGMVLYGIFSIFYLKKLGGVTGGHLMLGLVLAFIGMAVALLASKWGIEVSGEKIEIKQLLKGPFTIQISEIEKAETGSRGELTVFYKGKKMVTVDRLCINYDKLRDTFIRYDKLK